jgi:hypothetical protein
LAAGLLLVVGVALVHLHKVGEQLAALGGIGGLGADGKVLGSDLDLGPASRTQVVIPAGMVRGAAVGGAQHEAAAVADIGQRSGPLLADPPPGASKRIGLPAMDRPPMRSLVRRYSVERLFLHPSTWRVPQWVGVGWGLCGQAARCGAGSGPGSGSGIGGCGRDAGAPRWLAGVGSPEPGWLVGPLSQ